MVLDMAHVCSGVESFINFSCVNVGDGLPAVTVTDGVIWVSIPIVWVVVLMEPVTPVRVVTLMVLLFVLPTLFVAFTKI